MTTKMPTGVDTYSVRVDGVDPNAAADIDNLQDAVAQLQKITVGPMVFNVTGYGADPTGGTDSSVAIQNAINAANAVGGGTVFFPPGTYKFGTALSLDGMTGVRLVGVGAPSSGTGTASILSWTGTGSGSAISARSTYGCGMQRLFVRYTSNLFTGLLVDTSHSTTSDTGYALWEDCFFGGSGVSTAILLSLDKTINSVINRCAFGNCVTAIRGAAANGSYSNNILVASCTFISGGATSVWIQNAGQAWLFENCDFEPLSTGGPGILNYTGTLAGNGVSLLGCWIGDLTADGTAISYVGNNLNLRDCYAAGRAASTLVSLSGSSNFGLSITGCNLSTWSVVAAVGASVNNGIYVYGNSYNAVTTRVSGTPISGILDGASTLAGGIGGPLVYTAYRGRAYASGATSIPNNALTAVSLATKNYDPSTAISGAGVFTAPVAGYYHVSAHVEMAASCTQLVASITQNAVDNTLRGTYATAFGSHLEGVIPLAAGDTLTLKVYQNSGGAVSTATGTGFTYLDVHYLSS